MWGILGVEEYRTVILAAFLHDIGKLLGRGQFSSLDKGQHPEFSATFVNAYKEFFDKIADTKLLYTLVLKHHQDSRNFAPEFLVQSIAENHPRMLATLVSKADNLASSERGESSEQYQDYRTTPLCSVIERLNKEEEQEEVKLRFHPRSLLPTTSDFRGVIFPEQFTSYRAGEMNNLIQSFGKSFASYARACKEMTDFNCVVTQLTNIVYQHTWCIPSNTQEKMPDVSLFDHLKLTAATAACLYHYHQTTNSLNEKAIMSGSEQRFCLIAGDISGIQQYIFGITQAAGGVARRLRARSLFIQLCTEVAAHELLRRLRLPLWNLIMNSGGNFYILAPNLPHVIEMLEQYQRGVDEWFVKKVNGELALNLAYCSFGDYGFRASDEQGGGFSNVLAQVKVALGLKKQKRFASLVQLGGLWNPDSFVRNVNYGVKVFVSPVTSYRGK